MFLDPTYRALAPTDIATMKALLAMFSAAFEDHDSYQSAVPSDAYLARLLSRDTFIAVVAEVAGRVVGGLAGYVLDKFEQERREFYIYDLAVDSEFRRRGIASGMIRELQRVAAELGIYLIFVQADIEDDPAIALYATFGSRITAYHFDIDVLAGSAPHPEGNPRGKPEETPRKSPNVDQPRPSPTAVDAADDLE